MKVPNQYGGQDDRWVLVDPGLATDRGVEYSEIAASESLSAQAAYMNATDLASVPAASADADWDDDWD